MQELCSAVAEGEVGGNGGGGSAFEALLKKNKCLLDVKVECQANCW